MDVEENFPRGRGERTKRSLPQKSASSLTKKRKVSKDEPDLFKEKTFVPKVKDDSFFLPEVIATGMVVLGCVSEVRDFELVISLPDGMYGTVGIANICGPYTSALERIANSEDDEDSNVPSLDDLFYIGKLVRCKVIDIVVKDRKRILTLSLNPSEVNNEIKQLRTDMVLTGCIASCEDHGYVVDLGVKAVSAFLKMEDATVYSSQLGDRGRLFVGSYLHCVIGKVDQRGDTRVVNVFVDPQHVLASTVDLNAKIKMQYLLAGTVGLATVKKVLKDSVTVTFLSYPAIVHQFHLKSPINKYKSEQEIKVTVLYIDPVSKTIVLSELPHLTNPNRTQIELFGSLKIGDVIKNAVVLWTNPNHGAYLNLEDNQKAFASIHNAPDNFAKKVKTTYSRGTSHKCRVLRFNLVDRLAVVSLKKSVIKQPFLSYADIHPAAIVKCTVRNVHPSGVSVEVAHNILGLIPRLHLSEMLLKHPERKFVPGKKLKCKVLFVDPAKNKLHLTHKKSLVESESEAVTSYEQCVAGRVIEGCIVDVKHAGAVVLFYNNVKGFVPRRELSEQELDFPEKLFYLGQTVKCRVLNCRVDEEKMTLSLRVGRALTQSKSQVEVPGDWSVGKMFSCRVTKVGDAGLDVELAPDSIKAFLPKLVTKKESLINYWQDGKVATDFSALKLGMLTIGVLKRKMEYGVFVDLLNGLTGLAPKKYLLDNRHSDPASLLHEGQTLTAKVTEVDVAKNRFLVSIRSTDCFHGDSDVGIKLLSNYLGEYRDAIERLKASESAMSKLLALNVGQVVKVRVTAVSDNGITCELGGRIKGFATLEHMPGIVCKVGERHDSVVLHVDPIANCVQLTLNKEVIKAVENFKDNKFTKVREGQSIKADVQLVTEDFVLVLLKSHASGRFAYLPAKRHLNDVTERHQFLVSQLNNIIIKRIEPESFILANLETNETIAARADGSGKIMRQGEMPPIGAVETAFVRQAYDLQLNVSVNGFAGRIHITEMFDDCKQGCKLQDKFQIGSELPVKIIGYRTLKANKYLPITQADRNQIVLECSAKSSKLLSGDIEEDRAPKVGDKIAAYISSYRNHLFVMQLSPKVQATMHLLNASDDIEVLKKADDVFKIGSGHLVKVIGQGKRSDLDVSIADREPELRPGLVVPGLVLSVIKKRGIHVQLPCGQVGDAYLTDLSDEYVDQPESRFSANQFVKCFILNEIVGSRRKWAVSLRQSRIRKSKAIDAIDQEISSFDELSQHQILRGYVVSMSDSGCLVSFSSKVVGKVRSSSVKNANIELGKVVTTKVTALYPNTGHIDLVLVDQDNSRKGRVTQRDITTSDYDTGEEETSVNDNSCLSVPFTWDSAFSVPQTEIVKDSDSDTDVKTSTQSSKKRTKKITGKEREKQLYEAELRLVQPNLEPQTKEEFERLVFQSPLNSMCWLRYAAMHIAETDIDSARNVFKRALQAIPAVEEKERLNVWTAYLNTEFIYGSQSAAEELITWGMQHQDPVEIQRRVISIYERAGKIDMAEDIYKKMLISNKSDAVTWIDYTSFLYANGRMEAGRKLLGRAMLSVDKKKHVDMTCKVAQLEFRHGNIERGKSLFEEVVTNLPRRTDVWSIYIDACIKHNDINHARVLFDRVSSLKLHPKPMALFMRRFLEFEQKYGTEQSVEAVKRKAVTYCERS